MSCSGVSSSSPNFYGPRLTPPGQPDAEAGQFGSGPWPPRRRRLPARMRPDETPTPPGHRFRRRTSPARRTRQFAGSPICRLGRSTDLIGATVFMRPPSDGGSSISRHWSSGEGSLGKPLQAYASGPGRPSRGRPGRVIAPSLRRGKIGLYGASSPNEKPAPPMSRRVRAQPAAWSLLGSAPNCTRALTPA